LNKNYMDQMQREVRRLLIPLLRRQLRRICAALERQGFIEHDYSSLFVSNDGFARSSKALAEDVVAGVARTVVQEFRSKFALSLTVDDSGIVERITDQIVSKRDYYDQMFRLPPPRKEVRVRAKVDAALVPKPVLRAAHVQQKLKEWRRKQKLAATKVKQYRKKASYYQKKGLIEDENL